MTTNNQTPQGCARNAGTFVLYLLLLVLLLLFVTGGGLAVIAPLPGA